MEVLNREELSLVTGPNGKSLIQAVVSLTELPEPLVHQEMSEILQRAGQESEVLTLEQLRAAMLSYLEAIHEEMGFEDQDGVEAAAKTPVILE
jgi:hypothetical protein